MTDIDLIIERLELRGHRITQSRRRVLEAVLAQPAHFTVDDVLRHTRRGSRGGHVGRATVFRTIKILSDLNIVCRVLLDDGTLHYRLSTGRHHHHLVCTNCGRVEDFSNCDVASLTRDLQRATRYEIEAHWLEVYGRCQSCRLLADAKPDPTTERGRPRPRPAAGTPTERGRPRRRPAAGTPTERGRPRPRPADAKAVRRG